jgi:hypothetical protein
MDEKQIALLSAGVPIVAAEMDNHPASRVSLPCR